MAVPIGDRVRVVLVDDAEDLRILMRAQFMRDTRFEIVGEAADGREAVAVAAATQPDLIVLDRQMPGMDGLEAMPEIRRVSPSTAIILYTAYTDTKTYQAAIEAGAVDVLEKAGEGRFVDRLVDTLVKRAADEGATAELRVGPVSSASARIWVTNTRKIIDAVAAHPDVLDTEIPDDALQLFRSVLEQWLAIARTTDEFRWMARAHVRDAMQIVEHWATIDAMSDAQLEQLGVGWSPPEGNPFFQALTSGVLETLRRHDETQRLAARLRDQWAPFRGAADDR